jgi:hypothetical protein
MVHDKTQCHYFETPRKAVTMQWKHQSFACPKKSKPQQTAEKVILIDIMEPSKTFITPSRECPSTFMGVSSAMPNPM